MILTILFTYQWFITILHLYVAALVHSSISYVCFIQLVTAVTGLTKGAETVMQAQTHNYS